MRAWLAKQKILKGYEISSRTFQMRATISLVLSAIKEIQLATNTIEKSASKNNELSDEVVQTTKYLTKDSKTIEEISTNRSKIIYGES